MTHHIIDRRRVTCAVLIAGLATLAGCSGSEPSATSAVDADDGAAASSGSSVDPAQPATTGAGGEQPAGTKDSPGTDGQADDRPPAMRTGVEFVRSVIDEDPPSGDACCLDVITAGDVDGDGDGDVIIGTEFADGLSWYRNPGDGATTQEWERFPIGGGDFTTDGLADDLDGDGDLDVVVSSIDRNVVEWWEQVGDPTDESGWSRHDIGPDFAHDLVIVDVDGDGALDVGAFHNQANRVDWFRQPSDPSGAWTQHVVDELFGEGIAAGDLDGDGDTDLVAGPAVYSNDDGDGTAWTRTSLGDDWPEQVRSRIGDIDLDGRADIVMVSSETAGRLSWFRGPDWNESVIDPTADFTHSLEIADVDLDGDPDLLAGVMHTAAEPTVRVLLGDGGSTWDEVLLATTGTHNARFADLDGDGRPDVVGKNYEGPKQVEVWWSRTAAGGTGLLDGFRHVQVDDTRARFNDATAFFGLAFADVDGDGMDDIASGRYVYLNPGGDLTGTWRRIDLVDSLGSVVDVMLATDVDGDGSTDLIATALPDVWWLEAGPSPDEWDGRVVAQVPATPRPNGQGYRMGDITGDGRPEIVLSGGSGESDVWAIEIPADPESDDWPTTRITATATDEQIGVADIDGDGWNDVVAGDMKDGGSYIAWFENPGDGSADWERHRLGEFPGVYPDRLEVGDVDLDGRIDVVVTEENDGSKPDAEVMWYRQPDDPTETWTRYVIVEQFTTNGLDMTDLDDDGDLDIVVGEHRGDRRVTIHENGGTGADGNVVWIEHPVDAGKESHLGARVHDLDGDGDDEIVSIGWDEFQYLHLWVND